MTSWVGDADTPGPALRVLARSEPDRIHVDWDDGGLPAEDLPDVCAALRRFLDGANQLPAAASARRLPARHPDARELQLPGHRDEHRFFEVRMARLVTGSGWSEPSAGERERDAPVEALGPGPGHEYVAEWFGYGPYRGQPGVAEGPVVPLAVLVAALGSEIDRHA